MPSENERAKAREASLAKERAEDLKQALASAPSEEEQADMQARIAPISRDEDHSFVPVEETDVPDDPELLAPDLTRTGVAGLEPAPELVERELKKADGETAVVRVDEARLERMSDEEIKSSGVLKKPTELVHPARLAPTSERVRTPYQRSPAAGPGTWPVHEGQLPAVMPSDPPIEDRRAESEGDNTFTGVTGFSTKDGGLKLAHAGTVVNIAKNEVRHAAALYLRLRQQFPHFTTEMLNDEFAIQWEAGIGKRQSHRPSQELSQHGDTAVADPRITLVELGKERANAPEAQPGPSTLASPPAAGLPSENEPATRHPDDAKPDKGTSMDDADAKALETIEKFKEAPVEPSPPVGKVQAEANKAPPTAPPTAPPKAPAKTEEKK